MDRAKWARRNNEVMQDENLNISDFNPLVAKAYLETVD